MRSARAAATLVLVGLAACAFAASAAARQRWPVIGCADPRLESLHHYLWKFAPTGSCDTGGPLGSLTGIDHARWTNWGREQASATGMLIDGLGFEYPAEITASGLRSTHSFRGAHFYAKWYSKLHVIAQAESRGGVVRGPFDVVLNATPDGVPAPKLKTRMSVFYAFTRSGRPTVHTTSKRGYCWTGSLAAVRDDAWRCFVGNFIFDPCFSSAQDPGVVICPNPSLSGGIKILLTRGLPRRDADQGLPSLFNDPWNIELTDGRHCTFSSGASNVVAGNRLNYFCTGAVDYGLWGLPDRTVELSTIFSGPFSAKHLHTRRAIRHLWT